MILISKNHIEYLQSFTITVENIVIYEYRFISRFNIEYTGSQYSTMKRKPIDENETKSKIKMEKTDINETKQEQRENVFFFKNRAVKSYFDIQH